MCEKFNMKIQKDYLHKMHIHHTFFEKKHCGCIYFNWYLARMDLGFHLNISCHGIDFTFSCWGTISGYIMFKRPLPNPPQYIEDDE